jgi:hypothetical protein
MSGVSNSPKEQRARIIAHLQKGPLTTLQARIELNIMYPSTRVMELREEGHWIEKITVVVPSEGGKLKRVARYSLVPDGARMPSSMVARLARLAMQRGGR